MIAIKFQVDSEFIEKLAKQMGLETRVGVVKEALGLLQWAADERERGRVILSCDADGASLERLGGRFSRGLLNANRKDCP